MEVFQLEISKARDEATQNIMMETCDEATQNIMMETCDEATQNILSQIYFSVKNVAYTKFQSPHHQFYWNNYCSK